jgi:transcriptional antiterminator Rof (Rho-off)
METSKTLNKKYTPINGDFYDKLEAAAVQNVRCELIYRDDEGIEHNVISRIEDLYTHDHIEYAVLEEVTIRLDQIVNLNGESILPPKQHKRDEREEFNRRYYSSESIIRVSENDFYELVVDKERNLIELKVRNQWETMDEIPDLKQQLYMVSEYMENKIGLLNDFSSLTPDAQGTLIAPFVPARGILINAGLFKVADLVPDSCETIVHDRGSFSVNSIKVRTFKDRFFAENWLSQR